ncbi:hypothetical protein JCM21900_003099 [Sporobolomyces salmonicolor]
MEPPDDLSDSDYSNFASTAPTAAPPPATLKQQTLTFDQIQPAVYLAELNPAQREAVTASTAGGLQILAGPGSGKTAVLTRRVAFLVQHERISPEELVVVTFTNKAANEMKIRLSKIVGAQTVDKLVMGTFHSMCVRYLRKYAKLVNLASNFVIADRDDCLAMIKRLLGSLPVPDDLRRDMKPPTWLDHISKCKSRMIGPEQYRVEKAGGYDEEKAEWVARVFEAYQDELANGNALDFDDLLLRGYQLFRHHPRVVAKIKSVLIDEFQDTNSVQYDLVKLIAAASGSLTIVGDPDQSIYGWRSAEVENLEKMTKDFAPCRQIFLEQNYRSTGAILGAALAVVRQDTKRINKSLHSSHPTGSSVVLHCAPDAQTEAAFIAASIKHLIAHMGGLITYNDCAILLRYGALSRSIEVGLQKAGVPSRMVGGHKFFERAEVKDLLSYLQLLSNPSYTPALSRVLNTPRRGIGDKTQREILATAARKGITAFEVCVRIANGQGLVQGLTQAQKKGVKALVEIVRDGRRKADEGTDVANLIDFITAKTEYRQHLEKTQGPDAVDKWENVEELKSYATVVSSENPSTSDLATALDVEAEEADSQFDEVAIPSSASVAVGDDLEMDDSGFGEEEGEGKIVVPFSPQSAETGKSTPLEIFLATSMLATDTETQHAKSDANAEKVTISTCHSAKGLEWPIVFIPACEDGTYPFFRASEPNEVDEERRLLYVAITRTQTFCIISHANVRMAGAEMKTKRLSPFLTTVAQTYPTLFVSKLQKISGKTRGEMAKVLGRQMPDEDKVRLTIDEYTASLPLEPPSYDAVPGSSSQSFGSRNYGDIGASSASYSSQGRYGGGFTNSSANLSQGRWSNQALAGPQPVPVGAGGFRSALSTYKGGSAARGGGGGVTTNAFAPLRPANGAQPSGSFKPLRPAASASGSGIAPPPRAAASDRLTSQPYKPLRPIPSPQTPPVPNTPTTPSTSAASSSSSSSSSSSASHPTLFRPAPPDGPPSIVETRLSRINDAVLLNPVLSAPAPSTSRDLLANFQQSERGALEGFLKLGAGGGGEREREGAGERGQRARGGAEELDLTLSSEGDAVVPSSPRGAKLAPGKGKGKRAAPAGKRTGGAKKAKK